MQRRFTPSRNLLYNLYSKCAKGTYVAEIISIHEDPAAGKEALCERASKDGLDGTTIHYASAEERLRGIRGNTISSQFSEAIQAADPLAPLSDEITVGLTFESITEAGGEGIFLVEGPSHTRVVDLFRETIRAENHTLIGVIDLETSLETSIERAKLHYVSNNEQSIRTPEDIEDLTAYLYFRGKNTNKIAALALSRIAPWEIVNASGSEDEAYSKFRAALGRFALQSRQLTGEGEQPLQD